MARLRQFAKELAKATVSTPDAAALAAGDHAVLARAVDRVEAVRTARLDGLREFKATEPRPDHALRRVPRPGRGMRAAAAGVSRQDQGDLAQGRAETQEARRVRVGRTGALTPGPGGRGSRERRGGHRRHQPAGTGPALRRARAAPQGRPGQPAAAAVAAVEAVLADNRRRARSTLAAPPGPFATGRPSSCSGAI